MHAYDGSESRGTRESGGFFDTACPDVHDTHLWGILSHLFSAKINTKMIKKRSTKACRRHETPY
jgi:hypothetical protein